MRVVEYRSGGRGWGTGGPRGNHGRHSASASESIYIYMNVSPPRRGGGKAVGGWWEWAKILKFEGEGKRGEGACASHVWRRLLSRDCYRVLIDFHFHTLVSVERSWRVLEEEKKKRMRG